MLPGATYALCWTESLLQCIQIFQYLLVEKLHDKTTFSLPGLQGHNLNVLPKGWQGARVWRQEVP